MSANVSQPKPFQIAWNVWVFHVAVVAVVVIVDGVIGVVGSAIGFNHFKLKPNRQDK
jgi:nucleoside permease NupC